MICYIPMNTNSYFADCSLCLCFFFFFFFLCLSWSSLSFIEPSLSLSFFRYHSQLFSPWTFQILLVHPYHLCNSGTYNLIDVWAIICNYFWNMLLFSTKVRHAMGESFWENLLHQIISLCKHLEVWTHSIVFLGIIPTVNQHSYQHHPCPCPCPCLALYLCFSFF